MKKLITIIAVSFCTLISCTHKVQKTIDEKDIQVCVQCDNINDANPIWYVTAVFPYHNPYNYNPIFIPHIAWNKDSVPYITEYHFSDSISAKSFAKNFSTLDKYFTYLDSLDKALVRYNYIADSLKEAKFFRTIKIY